ncbi:MAG: class II aldolase/adducin family protein [Lachnospiraceae bacterium]|nr:class II aldolase/adducin family protein [Lachnospiraceae bacterium]
MVEYDKKIAEELATAAIRAYNRGIQTGSGGNISARIPGKDLMLLKASGGSLGDCTADSFLITDLKGRLVQGEGKPTREALLHGYIYQICPKVQAVVHVHAPYAIGWSLTGKDLPRTTWHAKLKICGDIPVLDIPAAMVREKDLPLVEQVFRRTPDIPALILANHGIVALGKDALEAEHTAELIEETAQVTLLKAAVQKLGL